MEIHGIWHPEGSAAQSEATLRFAGNRYTLKTAAGSCYTGSLDNVSITDRLGNVERKLTLDDGSVFSTRDNAAVDSLVKQGNPVSGVLHTLESNLGWVVFALVISCAFAFSFFRWGVPWVSTAVAHALPHKANELIGRGSLEFLDEYFFEESKIANQQRDEIRTRFEARLIPLEADQGEINYTLHFRAWNHYGKGIPNAFALPSGAIILTDKFIELAEHPDEIDAVLLHEMGHVVKRHSLEMVIEGTIVTTVVMLATGDNSGLADLGLGLGSLLASSHYSRGHEAEADSYAFGKMLVAGIDPQAFSNIMSRMARYMESGYPKAEQRGQDKRGENDQDEGIAEATDGPNRPADDEDDRKSLLDYISSHPSTAERIAQAARYSACFKKGLTSCD